MSRRETRARALRGSTAMDRESTIELLTGAIRDARDLATAHIEELRIEVKYAAAATALFTVAALLSAFALAQALWLYTTLPSWAAYLAIAGLFGAAGAALLWTRAGASLAASMRRRPTEPNHT